MLEQVKAMNNFLVAMNWQNPRYLKMNGDASNRHYYRLEKDNKTAILSCGPPEAVYSFIKIAQLLRAKDYSAPRIHGSEPAKGFMLLEDLGNYRFRELLEKPSADNGGDLEPRQLYMLALDTLTDLRQDFPEEEASCFLPSYDLEAFAEEHNLLIEWAFPDCPKAVAEKFNRIMEKLLRQALEKMPFCMVLRDYHVDNLMYIPSRKGTAACGLLDFQDAVCGPVGYDLASLLDDVRYQIPEDLKEKLLARAAKGYRLKQIELKEAVDIFSAQRLSKIIGIFNRLAKRDNKPAYLEYLPLTRQLLRQRLKTAGLAPLKEWFERYFPLLPADNPSAK